MIDGERLRGGAAARIAVTSFVGRVGDRNDRGMAGAALLGEELARRFGTEAMTIGVPEPASNGGWESELESARPALEAMAERYESLLDHRRVPVSAIGRCATALATLPVVARHRPDAVVLWFDAHPDLNTPENSTSGYLGGLALSGPLGLWHTGLGSALSLANTVLVGARDIDPSERRLIESGVIPFVPVGNGAVDSIRRPVYVHIDCDVLRPGIVPTDYRVLDGELHAIAETLEENELIGIEIGEYEAVWEENDEPGSPLLLLDALEPILRAAEHDR